MEGKDNRHKDKRSSMKHHKKSFHRKSTGNGSSSSQVEVIRGVIDVADSSDDRFTGRPMPWPSKEIDSELEVDIENEQLRAADFELLTQMPNSVGGHFQFSSEKNWDSEDMLLEKTEASEYFTLDLNLLNAGLQTIPFYKRLDFSSSWFSKSQLKGMNSAAEIAEKQYQIVVKEHESNHKGKQTESRRTSSRTQRNSARGVNSQASNEKVVNDNDKELDELLSLTTNEVAKISINDRQMWVYICMCTCLMNSIITTTTDF
ncbi:uncharacterized protein LOC129911069 isoform X2 [Episyrphus balteatus]|uniref:uncharacterized protein LOC129911069 isoform X2 n=1 Tax=Episyrphus balteatus TaxID=286459 RepID=UPI0024853A91|nr:uncharacterized protein LOC129911069 isoform X2 [Episyrphus balteatus]